MRHESRRDQIFTFCEFIVFDQDVLERETAKPGTEGAKADSDSDTDSDSDSKTQPQNLYRSAGNPIGHSKR